MRIARLLLPAIDPPLRVYCTAIAGLFAATVVSSAAAVSSADYLIYRARAGDTLIGLGLRLLAKPRDWVSVQRLNRISEPRRIPIGAEILIPARLLRLVPDPPRVVASVGSAQSGGRDVTIGQEVPAGSEIATKDDSYVTVQLADGSTLTMQPRTRMRVEAADRLPLGAAVRSTFDVPLGRVEVRASPATSGSGGMKVRIPATVLSVRGTAFRVAAEPSGLVRAEVVEGKVAAIGKSARLDLGAGDGLVSDLQPGRLTATRLLPPPDLTRVPRVQERLTIRIDMPPVADAAAYRAVLATDKTFHQVAAERVSGRLPISMAAPPDGPYWLRVRAIDGRGLEGFDAVGPLEIRARPEPPFIAAPVSGAAVRGDTVAFAWAGPIGSERFHWQLAANDQFDTLTRDEVSLAGTSALIAGISPGSYFWRMASITASGHQGPWGDVQRLTVRPAPAEPPPPSIADGELRFTWSAEPGQTFEFELASDPEFANPVRREPTKLAEIKFPKPAPGTYFMRVRATDPDGLVGPYTAPRRVDIPADPPWWLLLLLLPLL